MGRHHQPAGLSHCRPPDQCHIRRCPHGELHESLWSTEGEQGWNGTLTFNDNHVEYSKVSEYEDSMFGGHRNSLPDNIYAAKEDRNVLENQPGALPGNNADVAVGQGWKNGFPR